MLCLHKAAKKIKSELDLLEQLKYEELNQLREVSFSDKLGAFIESITLENLPV